MVEVELTEVAVPAEQKLMKMAERDEPAEPVGVIEPAEFVWPTRPALPVHSATSARSVEFARYHHFHP